MSMRGLAVTEMIDARQAWACSVVFAYLIEGADQKERDKLDHTLWMPPPGLDRDGGSGNGKPPMRARCSWPQWAVPGTSSTCARAERNRTVSFRRLTGERVRVRHFLGVEREARHGSSWGACEPRSLPTWSATCYYRCGQRPFAISWISRNTVAARNNHMIVVLNRRFRRPPLLIMKINLSFLYYI
jgi:hypothetical protein